MKRIAAATIAVVLGFGMSACSNSSGDSSSKSADSSSSAPAKETSSAPSDDASTPASDDSKSDDSKGSDTAASGDNLTAAEITKEHPDYNQIGDSALYLPVGNDWEYGKMSDEVPGALRYKNDAMVNILVHKLPMRIPLDQYGDALKQGKGIEKIEEIGCSLIPQLRDSKRCVGYRVTHNRNGSEQHAEILAVDSASGTYEITINIPDNSPAAKEAKLMLANAAWAFDK